MLDRAQDLSSTARIAWQEQDRQWPVRYHLAPERANLLRHLDFSGLNVLELGAGMGGVSRFLAEGCRHLTVVEGSSRRFRALASRLSDLDNWTGWFGRLEEFESPRKYDVVCLIGVLEYAERFIEPPADFDGDAFDYLLARLRDYLVPDGVLLLAIENRLGLKYWSGVAEDHSGQLFDGIVGYPDDAIARTFSRRELLGRLEGQGWCSQREYFPFPDYKLPVTVIEGRLAAADPELTADLACFHSFADTMRPRSLLFSDYLAMQQLARAGLFAEMANSFLWALSPQPESEVFARLTAGHLDPERPDGGCQVAWHASPARRRPVLTRFFLDGAGGVEVEKVSWLEPDVVEDSWKVDFAAPVGERTLHWRAAERQPVQRGERLRHRLLRALYFRQGQRVADLMVDYLRWVRRRFALPEEASGVGEEGTWLRGEALDALVTNVALGEPSTTAEPYLLYDQEWSFDGPIPMPWFILRNVNCLLSDALLAHPELGFDDLRGLYRHLCLAFGVEADLERDVAWEATLLRAVSARPNEGLDEALREGLEEPFSRVQPPRESDFATEWDKHLRHLVKVRRELEVGKSSLEEALAWHQQLVRTADEAAKWLRSNWEQSQADLAEKTQALGWLETQLEDARLTIGEYHKLEGEYGKLLAARDELERHARQLEANVQRLEREQGELNQRHHETLHELGFARRRIDELYGCLEELTQLLNGRAHRWLEMARRGFWRIVRPNRRRPSGALSRQAAGSADETSS